MPLWREAKKQGLKLPKVSQEQEASGASKFEGDDNRSDRISILKNGEVLYVYSIHLCTWDRLEYENGPRKTKQRQTGNDIFKGNININIFRETFQKLQFNSVQSLSRVRLFATPWIAARQASLSITNSRSHPNPRPSSQWYHPAISSSVIPFSSCPQSLPEIGRASCRERV